MRSSYSRLTGSILVILLFSASGALATDGSVSGIGAGGTPSPAANIPGGGAGNLRQVAAAVMQLQSQTAVSAPIPPHSVRSNPLAVIQSPAVEGGPTEPHALPNDTIWLMTASSQVFDFPYRIRRVSIADSKVADIQVINPNEINVVGHQPGFTTLTVWDEEGHYQQRQVRVDLGGKQQVMLKCVVAELDRGRLENVGVNLSVALQNAGLSLVGLPGAVATPFTSQSQIQILTPGGGLQTVNVGATLPPGGNLASMLLSPNLTYGLSTSNGQWNTQTFFQLLENHNLAKVLAEPDLLANSGEKAQFLSGGEIPIVIAQALNTSIVFKEYGTKVTFIPTVVGRDDIELFVEPEVSEPDYTHAVQLFGFTVPAFITRRAHTMVRLKTGRTLIIAGLNITEQHAVVQKVPYLGDIPYAGGLFRNTSYQKTSTDLVMAVTPELVAPVAQVNQVYLPTSAPPMTREEIKTKRLAVPDAARPRF
jgi:Flp pilus assembly secretin CpaC